VILGVGGLALAVAVGLFVALVLRGMSAAQPPPTASPPSGAPTVTGLPPEETTAPAAPGPRPEAGRNECVDDLGDGGVDLDSVQVAMRDDDLAVQFRLASPLPSGDWGVGLYIERRGDRAYQLGVALDGDRVDEVFVRDFDRADDVDVDRYEVKIEESAVTVVFPGDSIKRLGSKWSWYAFATAPGEVLDACPGTETEPELLPFER